MAEFLVGMIDCCVVALPFFALVALLLGWGDLALELGTAGALALGLALVRRWKRRWN